MATQQALKRLRQRAIRLLAQRDFSRAELARRLSSQPATRAAKSCNATGVDPALGEAVALPAGEEPTLPALADRVAWVIDDLSARGYLDDQRFAHALVRRESARHGVLLIERKLAEHGLDRDTAAAMLADARQGELARAYALWQRRFGAPPADLRERARQTRYLAQRGFSAEVVRRIVGGRLDSIEIGD
ncbi:MAG: regulatory protein RecX [Burkholderiaceae bacterium]